MNETNDKTALLRNLTLFFGGFLLFTDVFYLTMGILYEMPIIRYVIYFKLALNTTNLYFILHKRYLLATAIFYTVVVGFMIVGVVCMGTVPGFQLFAVGMLFCVSYNGYLHKRILKKELPLPLLFAIHAACYAGVYIYARTHEPIYDLPRSGEDILIFFNSAATFGTVIIYGWLFHNVAIRSEEKLEAVALVDHLTGLYNRHYFLAYLARMELETQPKTWLAILDIDDFKYVNDTYGHNGGDVVLHEVAQIARQICRDCIVCRWGGEEFIILASKPDCGTELLEILRSRIAAETFRHENREIHITITIGAAQYDSGLTNDGWISKADQNLYTGKHNGKDQVVQ